MRWLSDILDILRRECPWDRNQTINSLRYLTLEETYELSDAILASSYPDICKELGDMFMHILFYSRIAEDEKQFSLCNVIDGVCGKLISRHPHIPLPNRDGILQPASADQEPKWEQVKMKEGRHSALEGVPKGLPSLVKSIRMQEKAAGLSFEFPSAEAALNKVKEEYAELQETLERQKKTTEGKHHTPQIINSTQETDNEAVKEEYGDLLFALVKWGSMIGVNADDALSQTNQKFYRRFTHVEQGAINSGRTLPQLTKEEMTALWQEAKEQEKEE